MSNLILRPTDRTSMFINGASLHHAARNLGYEVDFSALREYIASRCNLQRVFYYAAMPEGDEYSPLRPLTDWLAYNGYHVVSKPAREFTSHSGQRRIKSNMNVEMSIDMLQQAHRLDHIILVSGDSDLRRACEAVQTLGVRVTTLSSVKTQPPMIGDDLRRQVDHFVDIADIIDNFIRRSNSGSDYPPSAPIRHPADVAMPDDDDDSDY